MLATYVTDFIDMVHFISKNVRTFLHGYFVDNLQGLAIVEVSGCKKHLLKYQHHVL